MPQPPVSAVMTPGPYTIGRDQTLAVAHRLMREHGIRHLPVLHGGKLVGVLSQRDLHFIETLKDVDPEEVTVSEAMNQDVFTTRPDAAVRDVAEEMAERKLGCAVVVQSGQVVGVFTTVDALSALSRLLRARPASDAPVAASG